MNRFFGGDSAASYYGVWANTDCELLMTEQFALFFERQGETLSVTLTSHYKQKPKLLLGKIVMRNGVREQITFINSGGRQDKISIGKIQKDGSLPVDFNQKPQSLTKIESISVVEPYETIPFSEERIGACLSEWNLGVCVYIKEDGSIIFKAGTPKHDYGFVLDSETILAQAARVAFNDKGCRFKINADANSSDGVTEVYMAPDNLRESAAPLEIVNAMFGIIPADVADRWEYRPFIKFVKEEGHQDAILLGAEPDNIFPISRRLPNSKSSADEWFASEN